MLADGHFQCNRMGSVLNASEIIILTVIDLISFKLNLIFFPLTSPFPSPDLPIFGRKAAVKLFQESDLGLGLKQTVLYAELLV